MQKNNEKYYILDILKFIMSLFIVLLHSTNTISGSEDAISFFNEYPIYYILSTIISRVGVPCFFIISGFLFFNKIKYKELKDQDFYCIKYCQRNLLYWFIASLCYIPFWLILKKGTTLTVNIFIKDFFFWGICFHLWYLLGVVIAISVVYILYRFKIKNIYIFIISLFLYLIGLFGSSKFSFLDGTILVNIIDVLLKVFLTFRNGLFAGTVFIFIGKYLSEIKILKMDSKKRVYHILLFVTLLFLLIFDIIKSENKMSDLNLLLIPLSYVLLRLILSFNISDNMEKICNLFRKISFYIYLIHPYIYLFLFISINNVSNNLKMIIIGILNIVISLIISLLFLFYKKILKKTRK